jgi:hypothetical protein
MLVGVFLGLVGWVALEAGTLRYAWWIVLPLWCLAALQGLAGFMLLRHRRMLVLQLTPEQFSFGETTIRHFQVTAVRTYRDLHFKGVRVDLGSDAWMPISATHHEPGRVIKAFREQGYPVV